MTYKNIPQYYKSIVQNNENIKNILLVGNKCDLADRKVKAKAITYHRKKNLQYYDMSVKEGF